MQVSIIGLAYWQTLRLKRRMRSRKRKMEQTAHLKSKVATLRLVSNNLQAREAEFLNAQRIAAGEIDERESQPAVVPQSCNC